MQLLLDHVDSPYIRAIGFLYLRYAGDPKTVWKWIEPYLYDDEPIQIQANVAKQQETIGDFVRMAFSKRDYCGTMLPRLPIQLEREIQVKLLQAEKVQERAQKNASNRQTMEHFKKLGSKCMALYGDEENPVQWYDAVIDRVITTNPETLQPLRNPKFIVTFPVYGNTETVALGEMEMPGTEVDEPPRRGGFSERGSDRRGYGNDTRNDDRGYHQSAGKRGYSDHDSGFRDDRGHGSRRDNYRGLGRDRGGHDDSSWSRSAQRGRVRDSPQYGAAALPTEDDLYEEVRRRERDTVTSSSRGPVARGHQGSSRSAGSFQSRSQRRNSPPPAQASPPAPRDRGQSPPLNGAPPRKRSAEELGAIQEKKRKLMAKYG